MKISIIAHLTAITKNCIHQTNLDAIQSSESKEDITLAPKLNMLLVGICKSMRK